MEGTGTTPVLLIHQQRDRTPIQAGEQYDIETLTVEE